MIVMLKKVVLNTCKWQKNNSKYKLPQINNIDMISNLLKSLQQYQNKFTRKHKLIKTFTPNNNQPIRHSKIYYSCHKYG